MKASFREIALSVQQFCRGAAGTGVFSVCSVGAAGWAAGAGMLSFLDFFALKAEASYMRVHGQKRGTAAKKAVCYNRRSFSSCNPGWAGNFQNQAGRSPADGNGHRRKSRLAIDIFIIVLYD